MQNEGSYSNNERRNLQYRPIGEVVRGIFFILFGLFAFFAEQLGMGEFRLPTNVIYIVGGILCAYGLFRVINGARKLLSK
ncbi:hypothetical protein MKQ68_25555 [Chitinophaga horti]|uniref:F0F1-ATPase subunit Ca2+/Mg2+ transporter n=1 Tax=Chitinophaga horti TaxID=2920382 RepID=A0ABY6J214_9BACT|nr:hypothetical protein [Chitinophaga horti]UYQ93436.1 hypothetical protein MKQ68_25555 [Chitinophaga horti]